MLHTNSNTFTTCYNNANNDYIAIRRASEKAEQELEKQKLESEKQKAKEEREKLAKEREEIRKENEKTAEERSKEAQAEIGDADTSNKAGPITSTTITSIDVTNLAVPLYYSDHKTVFRKLSVNQQISTQMHNILNNVSSYVKDNSDIIPRFETAGLYVAKSGYHGRGLAIDLFNAWSFSRNGSTYSPYSGQGTGTWNNYKKFICNVCNGQEDCKYNINYIIFEKYFKGNGWCWGGNWGPSSFDPMHFELRDGGCLTGNKQSISC